ncbi:ABC transporter substrate-binding protein [Paenibacillus sp. GCM10027626]|uniref:ABC transporter substrate-binding protein n=1 Tax=Paenibacillus sp. GCM10027626 TaxID=3273411 RepID=UPI00363BDC6B
MKRKVISRAFVLILSLILILALVACGENGKNSSQPSETPKSDVKLTLWGFKVSFDPGFKAVAEAFKQRTGVTVETQITTPDDSYNQKVQAASIVSDLPDLYLYWNGPAAGSFDGTAYEWSKDLEAETEWSNSFFPAALNGQKVTQGHIDAWKKDEKVSQWLKDRKVGEIFGLPIDVGTFYTIYGNAKLLKEAGVSTDAPATVEEWVSRMKTVKEKTGKAGFVFSGKTDSVYENWMATFQTYMKNGEKSFTDLMNRDAKLSDPAHIQMLTFVEQLGKDKLFPDGMVNLDVDQADQLFSRGEAAYLLGGTFTFANLSALGLTADDIVSFRVPAFEGSVQPDATTVPFGLVQIIANSKGKHLKEAVEFVKFLTSEEGMILYSNAAFDIPSVNVKDKSKLHPAIDAMLSSLSSEENWWSQNGSIRDKVFTNPEWRLFHELKQKLILGAITSEEAAKQFDETVAKEKAKEK